MQNPEITPVTVVYSDAYLDWQLRNGATDPRRAEIAVRHLREEMGDDLNLLDPLDVDRVELRSLIESVHDPRFVADVIDEGRAGDFPEVSKLLGETAATMFAGTVVAVREILAGNTRIAFNPQGAKHHARFDHSAGFCVFNDMAWAAREFAAHGYRPLYLDWDVHAGDGVQAMLFDTPIPTLSIHQAGAYPSDPMVKSMAEAGARHEFHHREHSAYNWNLERGAGDDALEWALDGAEAIIREHKPDVLLLAIGADGHEVVGNLGDTGSRYTYAGFHAAADRVRNLADELGVRGIVVGGAGGYRPLDHTPRIWADVVERLVEVK